MKEKLTLGTEAADTCWKRRILQFTCLYVVTLFGSGSFECMCSTFYFEIAGWTKENGSLLFSRGDTGDPTCRGPYHVGKNILFLSDGTNPSGHHEQTYHPQQFLSQDDWLWVICNAHVVALDTTPIESYHVDWRLLYVALDKGSNTASKKASEGP